MCPSVYLDSCFNKYSGALNDLAVQQSETSRQLAQFTQLILDTFINARDRLASEIKNQAENILQMKNTKLDNCYMPYRKRLLEYLRGELSPTGMLESPRGVEDPEGKSHETSAREPQIQQEIRLLMIENGILGSLSFATIADRVESVEKPHDQTFKWIYEEPGVSKRPWSNFVDWLREEDEIYWLNGKVGSGKSTLMRYTYENSQTIKELKQWAGEFPFETSGFFFYEDQKSQHGILRSLLFEILQRHRDLLPDIFPEAWRCWKSRCTAVVFNNIPLDSPILPPGPRPWKLGQVKDAFVQLLRILGGKRKLCVFVDGLDEYAGDYLDIIEFFQECSKIPNIKLCLSSRPLIVF